GRRTISKYGCAGCHDIPGFEDSKPIGTGLADWGRKAADKLAFEQIAQYVLHGHGAPGAHGAAHGAAGGHDAHGDGAKAEAAKAEAAPAAHSLNLESLDPTTGYFVQSLLGHQREGF